MQENKWAKDTNVQCIEKYTRLQLYEERSLSSIEREIQEISLQHFKKNEIRKLSNIKYCENWELLGVSQFVYL